MNKFEIVSKYVDKGLSLPARATQGAAGYDFEVAEDIIIHPYKYFYEEIDRKKWNFFQNSYETLFAPKSLQEIAEVTNILNTKPTLVPTGIKCKLDDGYYLELSVRSSLPLKHWLILANGVGIIDSDYYNNESNEGEIFFQLINLSPFDIKLKKGDRIGQGIIKQYYLIEGDNYKAGEKRKGGFGSTSKKLYNDFINVHGKNFSFKDNIESSTTEVINAPYVIGDEKNNIGETTTNVSTDEKYYPYKDFFNILFPQDDNELSFNSKDEDPYYQISFDDIL